MSCHSATSKFVFAKSIHDITRAVSLSNANSASCGRSRKVAGVVNVGLLNWNSTHWIDLAAIDLARMVQPRAGRADRPFKSAERYSETAGLHDH